MANLMRKIAGLMFFIFLPCLMTIVSLYIVNLYSIDNIKELDAEVMRIEVTESPHNRNPGKMKVKYKYKMNDKQYISTKEEPTIKVKVGDIKKITISLKNPQIIMDYSKKDSTIIVFSCFCVAILSCISGLICLIGEKNE